MTDNNNQNWITPKILSDSPLRDNDISRFHFDEFAITLARLISDPETRTPLTIGISGKWGSGKTTLLHRVKKLLDAMGNKGLLPFANEKEGNKNFRKCKTIWFNAWKYSNENELLVALIRVILDNMRQGNFFERLFGAILDPTIPRRNIIATLLNFIQLDFGVAKIGIDIEKYKVETPFAVNTSFFDRFNLTFDELLARWVHGRSNYGKIDPRKGALVVFIDDLDRCLPQKVVQVLEVIKLFLDKDGCIFVLGADTRIIQEALSKYGIKDEDVDDYIEKIIQLRFYLPLIPEEDMNSYVAEQVEDKTLVEHWKIISAGTEANPRKVKTFLNDLRLRWAMWQNTGQAGGVNFNDFVRWEVLMRAAPKFQTRIYGISDRQVRYSLVQNAFKMAEGDITASASFIGDVNQQMQEILKNILPYKEKFTFNVVNRLIYITSSYIFEESQNQGQSLIDKENTKAELQEIQGKLEEPNLDDSFLARRHRNIKRLAPEIIDVSIQTDFSLFADIPFIKIPKGKFLMGSHIDSKFASDAEKPQHVIEIEQDFLISQTPVTNEQFAKFIESTNIRTLSEEEGGWTGTKYELGFDWRHPLGPKYSFDEKLDHPVVQINWYEALEFCSWLNRVYEKSLEAGYIFRLPTEAEWEKAARGEFGNEWPWGNDLDQTKCNSQEERKGETTPVGMYSPKGDSPYGVIDMAGNVWEWTQSLWGPESRIPVFVYPYNHYDGREKLLAEDGMCRVLRGGSFLRSVKDARCAFRGHNIPDARRHNFGFRVVIAPTLNY